MDKKSPNKFSTMFGWWVGLGVSGKIKCAVLGRLVEGKTALLILLSVGIFLVVCCRLCRSFRVTANVPTLGVRAGFRRTKLSTNHKSPIEKLNLNVSTSPRMTPNVCYRFVLLFCRVVVCPLLRSFGAFAW